MFEVLSTCAILLRRQVSVWGRGKLEISKELHHLKDAPSYPLVFESLLTVRSCLFPSACFSHEPSLIISLLVIHLISPLFLTFLAVIKHQSASTCLDTIHSAAFSAKNHPSPLCSTFPSPANFFKTCSTPLSAGPCKLSGTSL